MKAHGLLLAAGTSTRFGGDKLFTPLPSGKAVWREAFDALAKAASVESVGIVCPPGRESRFAGVEAAFIVAGGANRGASCRNGLQRIPTDTVVLVHDAARPFATPDLVDRVVYAAHEHGAAAPVVPVTDTLHRVEGAVLAEAASREGLVRTQTPQAARRDTLLATDLEAHTDEASALRAAGVPVYPVAGDPRNAKITTVQDLPQIAVTTTGFGFDIHAFSNDPNRRLMLGGVHFEECPGLEGHSDADVLLHALTDALLGAIGAGDIGILFPNTDPTLSGADSAIFLREAAKRVTQAGGAIVSVDLTLLAESPKLGDSRQKIVERISQELGIDPSRVNVKATTMEGLGAIGRNEGIAAMATATVARLLAT